MIPRPATPADATELVRVINLAYQVEADMFVGERTSENDVRERLAMPGAAFLVLDDPAAGAGRLIGAVCVETRGPRGYFAMLSVDPAFQGRGLGRMLVHAVEAHCRAAGCRILEIDVVDLRLELPGFYSSLGFTEIGSTPYPDRTRIKRPVQLIRMERSLA